MKNKTIFILFTSIDSILISSYHNGPGSDCSGAHLPPSCTWSGNGCHSSGSLGVTSVFLEIQDNITGNTVSLYQPNKTYLVSLWGKNSLYSAYGFQLTCFDDSMKQAGTIFTNSLSHIIKEFPSTPYEYQMAEQSATLNQDIDSLLKVELIWHSSSANRGKVTFYSVVNAVNIDLTCDGDNPAYLQTVLNSEPNLLDNMHSTDPFTIYPNPTTNFIYFDQLPKSTSITIANCQGETALQTIRLHSPSLSLQHLPNGIYYITLRQHAFQKTILLKMQH